MQGAKAAPVRERNVSPKVEKSLDDLDHLGTGGGGLGKCRSFATHMEPAGVSPTIL